jgi:hypothetical protein
MNLLTYSEPFFHIAGSLEPEFYDLVNDSWDTVKNENYNPSTGNRANTNVPESEYIFKKLNTFLLETYKICVPEIVKCYPKIVEKEIQLKSRILYSENKADDNGYKIRGWHLDTGEKILVGLWYFKHPDEEDCGGDLMIMNPKTKETKTIPYASNQLILFPNTMSAWHAVTPRKPSKYPRRYINFLLESPDTKLHNYQRSGTSVDDEFRGKLVNYFA